VALLSPDGGINQQRAMPQQLTLKGISPNEFS